MQKSNNIFAEIPTTAMEEIVEELVRSKSVRIERIVSTGQITPEDYWYDQDQNEWVIVLKGNGDKGFCAGLDMKETMELAPTMGIPEFYRFQMRLARLNLAMRRAPQPIIAAVHGAAPAKTARKRAANCVSGSARSTGHPPVRAARADYSGLWALSGERLLRSGRGIGGDSEQLPGNLCVAPCITPRLVKVSFWYMLRA